LLLVLLPSRHCFRPLLSVSFKHAPKLNVSVCSRV
jgi:hypothetical protein